MSIANKYLLIFILTLSAIIVHAKNKINNISYADNTFYAGESSGGNLISIFEANNYSDFSTYQFKRIDLSSDEISLFSIEHYVDESDLSPNGQYQAWVKGSSVENPDETLWYYDYENEQFLEILIVNNLDEPVIIKSPKFVKETNQIAFLTGDSGSFGRRYYNSINITDIPSGNTQSIEQLPLEPDFGWFSITDYKISHDGRSVVYYLLNHYVAGDCCFAKPGYLIHYDIDTKQSTVILDQTDQQLDGIVRFDVAGDGSTIVYQDRGNLMLFNTEESTYETLDISNISGDKINWLSISNNGQTLAFSSHGLFSDGNDFNNLSQFIVDDNLPAGMNQKMGLRDHPIWIMDLNTNKTDIANKFNNYQLFKAQPISLSADGSFLNLRTRQQTTTGEVELYLRHELNYAFEADAAMTGTWFDPDTPGQGITVNFAPSADDMNGQAIVTWYTVDLSGQPLWLIMQAYIDGNVLTGEALMVSGSEFGVNFNSDELERITWGTLSLEFFNCKSAQLSYEPILPGYQEGQLGLVRLSSQVGIGCL